MKHKATFEVFYPGDMTRYEMALQDIGTKNEAILTVMTSGHGHSVIISKKTKLSERYLQSKIPTANPMMVKAAVCWAGKQGLDVEFEPPKHIVNYGNRDIESYHHYRTYY